MSPEVAAWFGAWWPVWGPLLGIALLASGTGIWAMITRRDGERVIRKSPLPPTWPEMWARIDAQDTRIDALVAERDRKDDQIDDLITHILKLELLVPTPPGPPARPAWITR